MECFVCLWLALWFFICSFFPSRIPTLITPKSCRVATPAQRLINALLVVASSSSSSRPFRPRLCWCWIRKKRAETRPKKKNTKIQSGDTFLHCWDIRNSPLSIRVWPPPFSRRSHLQSAVMALLMLGQWHAQLFPFLFLFSGLLFPYMRQRWESHEQWKARAIYNNNKRIESDSYLERTECPITHVFMKFRKPPAHTPNKTCNQKERGVWNNTLNFRPGNILIAQQDSPTISVILYYIFSAVFLLLHITPFSVCVMAAVRL